LPTIKSLYPIQPQAESHGPLAHCRRWNKPPPPRQRPIRRYCRPPMPVGSLSVYLSLSLDKRSYIQSKRDYRWSWRLGRNHAGSRGLLTHAGLRPAWVRWVRKSHAGGSADLSSDFFFPFPSSLLPPMRMRERRSTGNQEGNRHTKCPRRKREHRRTRGYQQACPVISLSGVVRLGGEPWVDFLIFRGFGYYLVFWFYFMKVYLVRCQPFNGRQKTHVFCKDQTAAALVKYIKGYALKNISEASYAFRSTCIVFLRKNY
jgi:hypothetical protein